MIHSMRPGRDADQRGVCIEKCFHGQYISRVSQKRPAKILLLILLCTNVKSTECLTAQLFETIWRKASDRVILTNVQKARSIV